MACCRRTAPRVTAIRERLAAHRGAEANAVMALNPRYIFFRIDPDDGGDPAGAAGVPLPARRAIAVDPAHWRYGDFVWISADGGDLRGARGSYQGAVMALDTGSAIRGPVRADLYMGRGESRRGGRPGPCAIRCACGAWSPVRINSVTNGGALAPPSPVSRQLESRSVFWSQADPP